MPNSSAPILRAKLRGDTTALALAQVQQSLDSSGSSWIVAAGHQEALCAHEGASVARYNGTYYVSTAKAGGAEHKLSNWMRSRVAQSAPAVPLISGGLTPGQCDAARLLLSNPVPCLSGLPGSGKTYTANAVCESLAAYGYTIIGCALTGIASSRLRDTAQINATTIHRLLDFDGKKFRLDQIPADVVVLDEASMVSPGLTLAIASRLPRGGRLIIIGDPDQLPSIEPGDTFRNLCGWLPHAHLTEVMRQEADSPLGNAAKAILAGSVPQSEGSPTGIGGIWVSVCDGLSIDSKGKREKNHPLSIAEQMAHKDGTELRAVRTMAFSNDAVGRLNNVYGVHRRNKRERVPVMCLKNRHELQVYNGDIGYRDFRTQVFGDKGIILRQSEQVDAWATTVHKLQGQECLSALLWVEPFGNRQLAYTALTRAKRRFVFVGNPQALIQAIQTDPPKRVTLLPHFLSGEATIIEG